MSPPSPPDTPAIEPAEYVHADHRLRRRNGLWFLVLAVVILLLVMAVAYAGRAYDRAQAAEDRARDATTALASALSQQQQQFIYCTDKKAARYPECAEPVTDDATQVVEGATGAQGDTGATGAQGPSGPSGAQGRPGPTGDTGAAGTTGATGPPGDAGQDGKDGAAGAPGAAGAAGEAGPPGPQGEQGSTGAVGPAGEQGPPGPTCPADYSLQPRTALTTDAPLGEPVLVCVPDPVGP